MPDEKIKDEVNDPGRVKGGKRLWIICSGILAILVIGDFFIHKHSEFSWANIPGFFAVYGFLSCLVLILAVKLVRFFVKRDEDYRL